MSTFVLVHGSWHGAWCWERIVLMLEEAGHRVIALDLPGHGQDHTPLAEVNLKSYTDHLNAILEKESEKVILVGHSMAGLVISQTAEYLPEKIEKLVYLCAYLPENGQTLLQISQNEKKDKESPSIVIISEDQTFMDIKDELIKESFYGDCSEEEVIKAKEKLCLEPLAPFFTPVNLTAARFGMIPRVYIETLRDKAISIGLQRDMYTVSHCNQVITMDSDHSPFFSHPGELSSHLIHLTF
ncbi:alpha/beta fold hydrolase [Paenibacillus qinlingensis]|uniref:Pimeloyl-ACP methyl ester carboxylesterase n=1 Tax=Paenibacillus qinlingensis TaxID=1837343 RepID=A0ABU1NSE2_9BACL|nr:alpha/beta fold hydrolase [Paenibacillus qinlingensis]MDR6550364.1 pimeloyl-ACP methyl ester carboxylesterase [Paenibacillus qinlingensis]